MDDYLVDPEWLQANLRAPGVVTIDCTWYLPETGKSGRDEYRQRHIPGARYVDLDEISDPDSPYVNMLPSQALFERRVGEMGIDNDTMVVVHDANYVSARLWWMFRTFGHDRVRVLDGGLRRWIAEGRPVESGDPAPVEPATFRAAAPAPRIAGWRDVLGAIEGGGAAIVDARTSGRFTGEMSSGYPGVPGGHMPGAVNVPWSTLIEQAGAFRFVDTDTARRLFEDAGVDLARPVIATCGSGVTACVVAFHLERLGKRDCTVYDASWHEWGQRPDLPKRSV